MPAERFENLARELCARDSDLAEPLSRSRVHLSALRERACERVATFAAVALRGGAAHLTSLAVSPVEPDEKHVDCLQFTVTRGRWEIVCVAKPRGTVTLVGPYRRGKPERPCQDHALPGEPAEAALDELLLELIREACAR